MRAWIASRDPDEVDDIAEWEDLPSDLLARPDISWDLFCLCSATEWNALPYRGGWVDQPDWFIHDMRILTRRIAYLRKIEAHNKEIRKKAREQIGFFRRRK